MSYSEFHKTQTKHLRCVICGRIFGSVYDESINAHPVYHPLGFRNNRFDCEDIFYNELLNLYRYIHVRGDSVPIRELYHDYHWDSKILMKKEMLEWCVAKGYFYMDNLKRMDVPPPIRDACKEIFSHDQLENPMNVQHALELLKSALKCFNNDLVTVHEDEIPIQVERIDRGESTLFHRIDTSKVLLKRDKPGMATADCSGAREIEKRISCASGSMERRRLDSHP